MAGGKRRADTHSHARPRLGPLSRLGGTVLGIVLGCVAWWILVRAAIDFGHLAGAGESRAWAFAIAASVGAVLCLLLVLVLASRVLVTLGVVSQYQPRRAAPKRRAEPAGEPSREPAREAAPHRGSREHTPREGSRRAERAHPPRRADRDDAPGRRAARHSDAPEADRTVG